MSTRQRDRATRRQATRARGNVPPVRVASDEGGDVIGLTPKGRAMLDGITEKWARGVPVEQLSEDERALVCVLLAAGPEAWL